MELLLRSSRSTGRRAISGLSVHAGTLACDGHRDAAENEALAKEKHYRLIPIPLNA